MKTEISAQTISYDESGMGPPVLLLHAFPLSRSMWASQMEALQDAYRVIAPDLRGFGGSKGFDDPPSLDQVADDVAGLLDELKIKERIVLGGLSMGGYAALAFARRHAGRLRGLILADTKAEADDAEGKANRDRLIAFASQNTARAVLDQMLPKLLPAETLTAHPEVIDLLRHIATDQTPAAIIGALRGNARSARLESVAVGHHRADAGYGGRERHAHAAGAGGDLGGADSRREAGAHRGRRSLVEPGEAGTL